MFQDVSNPIGCKPTSFWDGCFNDRMDALIARNHRRQARLHRLPPGSTMKMIEDVRDLLPLADRVAVARMLEKNPDIIRCVTVPGQNGSAGIFAYLPLNAYGAWALMTGRYDGSKPDPAWICTAGEKPSAIAIWLIVAPGLLLRMFEPIARLFRELCPEGCAIISYGATDASASIQRAVGFRPAQEIFPGASSHLVAACPNNAVPIDIARDVERTRRGHVHVRIARSIEDMAKVFSVRSATFQAEQSCPYEEEFDGNDFCATQLLAYVGDDPAACIRIRYFGDFAKLERLAIRREYRSRRLSRPLVEAALAHCARKGFRRIYGHSRSDLVGFWQRLGFDVIPERPPFWFSDVEYVEIVAELSADADHEHPSWGFVHIGRRVWRHFWGLYVWRSLQGDDDRGRGCFPRDPLSVRAQQSGLYDGPGLRPGASRR